MKTLQEQLDLAIALASEHHYGQKQKDKQTPYILHPLTLMFRCEDISEKIVAVMHDLVEDTDVTLEMLTSWDFSTSIVDAVDAITHRKDESYESYVERVAANPIARAVKIQDLQHNMDVTRLPKINQATLDRVAKYHRVWSLLTTPNNGEHA